MGTTCHIDCLFGHLGNVGLKRPSFKTKQIICGIHRGHHSDHPSIHLSICLSIHLRLPHPIIICFHHPKSSPLSHNNRKFQHVGLSGPLTFSLFFFCFLYASLVTLRHSLESMRNKIQKKIEELGVTQHFQEGPWHYQYRPNNATIQIIQYIWLVKVYWNCRKGIDWFANLSILGAVLRKMQIARVKEQCFFRFALLKESH